jgi:hypothetical protein
MDEYTSVIQLIAILLGLSWASGLNLYAAMLTLGLLGATGNAVLPSGLEILSHPMVIAASGFMYLIEFGVDKVPGLDTGWDLLHTFVRIPAGAILAAAATMEIGPAAQVAAALVGGSLAAGSHLTKSGTRAVINTLPEPFTNWGVSLVEDLVVIGSMWFVLSHPVFFLVFLGVFVLGMIWFLPRLWRFGCRVFRKIVSVFSDKASQTSTNSLPLN